MFEDIDIACRPHNQFIHFFDQDKNTDMYFVQFGYHATPKSYGFGPLIRDHYLIHFIKSGKGVLILNNRKYLIHTGQCFLIAPNQIAYYESDPTEPLEYYWIGFNGYHALSYIKQSGFSVDLPVRLIGDSSNDIFHEFAHIHGLGYDKKNFLAYQGFLYYILFYLTHTSATLHSLTSSFTYIDNSKISKLDYVQKVIDIIQSSYQCEIIVEEISTKLSLNRSYLAKIFKDHTGFSIKQYLIDYRLNIASILLRDPNKTVSEIALEVGFKDPLYFSKAFHKKYNMSPTEYKKVSPFSF